MKANTLKFLLALGLSLGAASGQAATYHADISIDPALFTSGSLAVPFFLDFQLNSGGGASPVSNAVTISGFAFSGTGTPGPVGSPVTSGFVFGNLSSSVTLIADAANPFNELYQGFSNGTTTISFNFNTSENLNTDAPDLFAVAILDSSAGNPQIPTSAPDTVSLVSFTISSPVQLETFSGTGAATGVNASASPVPVPAAFWLLGSALAGMGVFGRRRAA